MAALTSAEISLPSMPDALRVRERIAALADTVDVVALTGPTVKFTVAVWVIVIESVVSVAV